MVNVIPIPVKHIEYLPRDRQKEANHGMPTEFVTHRGFKRGEVIVFAAAENKGKSKLNEPI